MPLTICKECRGKISTKAEACPHCGNVITTDMFNSINECKIINKLYDLTPLLDEIMGNELYEDDAKKQEFISFLSELTDCDSVVILFNYIRNTNGRIPLEFNGKSDGIIERENISCPVVYEDTRKKVYSICGECRKKISTDMSLCPHCGNKITPNMFNMENVCKINGIDYDFTTYVNEYKRGVDHDWDIVLPELEELTDCAAIMSVFCEMRLNKGRVPSTFDGWTVAYAEEQAIKNTSNHPHPKCPTCGSGKVHKIGFGERTLSVNLFGLSSNKFNKSFECNNCGYTW